MNRRDFIRNISHLGLAGSGAMLIPVGLSGCVVASKPNAAGRPPGIETDAPLAYGTPLKRARLAGDGTPRMIVVFLRGAVDGSRLMSGAELRPGVKRPPGELAESA